MENSKQYKQEAYSELVDSIIKLANRPTKEKCQQAINDAFILYMMAKNNLDGLEEIEIPTDEKLVSLDDYRKN